MLNSRRMSIAGALKSLIRSLRLLHCYQDTRQLGLIPQLPKLAREREALSAQVAASACFVAEEYPRR